MDVRSAYNSGLTGFQDASAKLSNASSRIAQAGAAGNSVNENQQATEINSSPAERAPISLTTELVNLKVAEYQAKASAKVISSADEVMGTLINTSV
ncbi:flagellar basal body rod C-terminal domain-containing protein [Psychromonas sp. MME2]|uniref:flagellar basal body rod C-terminal domain-containing protein n=1 Tax=unclassified Psychromonas TaxID=2614957 RepID=UPI00339C8FAA